MDLTVADFFVGPRDGRANGPAADGRSKGANPAGGDAAFHGNGRAANTGVFLIDVDGSAPGEELGLGLGAVA